MNKNAHIFELELSTRANNALLSYSIYENGTWKHEPLDTIGKVIEKSENDLLKTPNLGRKSLNEIIYTLDVHGLKLANYKENIKIPKKIPMRDLDLRDYFAAKAMQADITNYEDNSKFGPDFWLCENISKRAYNMADAMIKARTK
jgi:hypothetical protein